MSIHVVVIGNVTREPEVRDIGTSSITKFGVASNRRVKGEDIPSFLDVEAWADRGGKFVAEYVKKGSLVIVSGELEQQNWEDKETGAKRSKFVCKANSVSFGPMPKKKEEAQEDQDQEEAPPAPVAKKPTAKPIAKPAASVKKPVAARKPAPVLESSEEEDYSEIGNLDEVENQ